MPLSSNQFRTERTATGVRYCLPLRRSGTYLGVGVSLVAFTIFWNSMTWSFLLKALDDTGNESGAFFGLLFMVPFVLAGLALAGIALLTLFGTSAIEIHADRIIAIERIGPFFWRRSRPRDKLREFRVVTNGADYNSWIIAEFNGARKMTMALVYPRATLRRLAERLSADLSKEQRGSLIPDDNAAAIPVSEHQMRPTGGVEYRTDEHAGRPAGTQVVLEKRPDGLTLIIPPTGVRKGDNLPLLIFGAMWLTIATVIAFTTLRDEGGESETAMQGIGAFIPIFYCIGLFIIAIAVYKGTRRAIIDVVGSAGHNVNSVPKEQRGLLVTRRSILGTKQHQWLGGDIESITVGPSGAKTNGRSLYQLKIHAADNKKTGLFTGRDTDELRWIARVLCNALDI